MPELAPVFAPSSTPRRITPPRCIIVTGPQGATATGWLEGCVRRLACWQPATRCGVLLADQSLGRKETVCADTPGVVVRTCFLPCTCCPAAAALPSAVREVVQASEANWLFIELPVIAAPGLIAEFDRVVRWPRTIVVSLTPTWERARRLGSLSPFQMLLLETADLTIANDREATAAFARIVPDGSIAREFPIGFPRGAGLAKATRPVCRRR